MHIKPTDLSTEHLIGLPANTDYFTRARLGVYVWRRTTAMGDVGAVVVAESAVQAWAKLKEDIRPAYNIEAFIGYDPVRWEFDDWFPSQVFGL
jgi:hypothetical protein